MAVGSRKFVDRWNVADTIICHNGYITHCHESLALHCSTQLLASVLDSSLSIRFDYQRNEVLVMNVKERSYSIGKGLLLMVWFYFLYQVSAIPMVIPTLKTIKELWIKIILFVLGIVLSYLLMKYIWDYFAGDFHPDVEFLPSFDRKHKVVIYIILAILLLVLVGWSSYVVPTSDNQSEIIDMFGKGKWNTIVSVVALGPIIEELIFRGALQKLFFRRIETKWQMGLYIIISTALFTWIHGTPFNAQMIPYLVMGVIFSSSYVLLGDIKYDISLHILNNLISIIMMSI